jgi:D-psicose/D-tagatose/L-ribulose 3-epimerase
MNKIGIYYAYWTHDWDADFHPFIDRAAGLGFDVLEVNAGTIAGMSSAERHGLKAHADHRNVVLTYCIGLPPRCDIASEDESVRQNGIAYLQAMAKAIGDMGGGVLGGVIYSCWPPR